MKVSCITVTKNRLSFLKKSIRYFIEQTYNNKEMVIVYYNTDDETKKFLLENKQYLNSNNIYFYVFIEDDGLYLGTIRNYAISKSTGDWIMIWDDDDYYDEDRIKCQLEYCIENNLKASTLLNIYIYSIKHQVVKCTFNRETGWEGSLIIRKDVMPKYKNLPIHEDTPLLLEIVDKDWFKTQNMSYLYVYILHDNNISNNRHKDNIVENSSEISSTEMLRVKDLLDWI